MPYKIMSHLKNSYFYCMKMYFLFTISKVLIFSLKFKMNVATILKYYSVTTLLVSDVRAKLC